MLLREQPPFPLAAEAIKLLLEVQAVGTKADACLHKEVQATAAAAAASRLTGLRVRRVHDDGIMMIIVVSFTAAERRR